MTFNFDTNIEKEEWNQFVDRQTKGNYCHLYQWKDIIRETYQLDSSYLAVREGDKILAILPTTLCKTISGKKKGVSVAFNGYGGLLIDQQLSNKDTNAFIKKETMRFIIRHLNIKSLEIRSLGNPIESGKKNAEASLILPLKNTSEELLKSFKSKLRSQIKKAQNNKVLVKQDEECQKFFNVYAKNIGQLGTPIHHIRFFKKIKEHFNKNCTFLNASFQNNIIGGMLLLQYKGAWCDPFASTLREYNHLSPNMAMYWKALEIACHNGGKYFDMGRSQQNSGTYKFKKQWGAIPYELKYENVDHELNPTSSNIQFYRSTKAQTISNCWAHLPFNIQCFLGPKLRKFIP